METHRDRSHKSQTYYTLLMQERSDIRKRVFSVFMAIGFPFLFLLIWKVSQETSKARNSTYKISDTVDEVPDIYKVDATQSFSWDYLVNSTLSASLHSTSMRIAMGILIAVSISTYFMVLTRFKRGITSFDFLVVPLLMVFGCINTLLYIRDLPDEAYVWGSKVENFLAFGRLGVELDDGTFAESTVGTLQFILAAILKALFRLTTEQSLLIPIMFGYLATIGISYALLRRYWNGYLIPLAFSLVLIFSTKFILNVANAFDNILAIFLLAFWVSSELSPGLKPQLRRTRFVVAVLGPLIRIDLLVLSIIALSLSFMDISKGTHSRSIRAWTKPVIPEITLGFLLLSIWISYKLWAFGGLQPAMLKYKSPSFDLAYIWEGTKYSIISVGKLTSVFILVFALLSMRFLFEQYRSIHILLLAILFLVISQLAAAVTSGGDYFGPLLARYVLPSVFVSVLVLLVLVSPGFLGRSLGIQTLPIVLLVISLTFSLLNDAPSTSPLLDRYPFKQSPIGRVTCDNMAINTLKTFLVSQGRKQISIMTAEVNNAAYHLDARLIDTMGLVDSKLFPRDPNPYSPGNTLRKFRIIPEEDVVARADVMWLYGSAACQDFDPRSFMAMGETQSIERKFLDLFNSHQALYRYDFDMLWRLNFVPTHLKFTYRIPSEARDRRGEVFALVRMTA